MSLEITKITKEFEGKNIIIHNSPKQQCWRLIYEDNIVYGLFESNNITSTAKNLFCGTWDECLDKIEELKLDIKLISDMF